jgi:hypothetical protein
MTKKEHQSQASFHTEMSEQCAKAADLHEQLATASEGEKHAEMHKDLASCHRAMGDAHAAEGERHLTACKTATDELEKAGDGELAETLRDLRKFLGNVVVPIGGISAIPTSDRPRPILRHGQHDLTESRKAMAPELRDAIAPTEEVAPSVEWGQRAQ